MKLSRLRLQGFRTIARGLDCTLTPLTIFTGANNSGKSGIIRALDLFFNSGNDPASCFPHVRTNPMAKKRAKRFTMLITVWFAELPADLSTKYSSNLNTRHELPVRMRYYPKTNTLDYLVFASGTVRDGVTDGTVNKTIYGDICDHLLMRVIPESRDIQREFRTELGEAYASLKESIVQSASSKATRAAAELHEALNDILDREITKRLNRNIGDIIPDHAFKIGTLEKSEFAKIVMHESLSRYPICAQSPDGDEFPLEQVGAGFQSNVLIALHRAVAALAEKQLLLCVEEPEIHLDPNAQRRAYHEWHRVSTEPNKVEQILITTHSAFIVNEASPEELVVVRRGSGNVTTCSQLTSDFLAKHDAMHLRMKVLAMRNSDLFFSTAVVLVEGDSDAVALRGCLDLLCRSSPSSKATGSIGITIIDCGGAKSIVPLARVVRKLGIPYVLVFDRDFLQTTDSSDGAERTYRAEAAPTFASLEEMCESSEQFATMKAAVSARFCAGRAATYPLGINRDLIRHRILIMRTEHETDFIDDNSAPYVADAVGYTIPPGQSIADTVEQLKLHHRKQIKNAVTTARVLSEIKDKAHLPTVYYRICYEILNALKVLRS